MSDHHGRNTQSMAYDPKAVWYDQRVAAGKTTINGVSIVPKEDTIAVGRKIVDWRADIAVAAIRKALSAAPTP